jgi:NAD-dependent DNA ligase
MTPRREAALDRLQRMHARKYNPIVDAETRLRIKVALYAYTYEYEAVSLVSDGEFDELCSRINLEISTRRPDLDKWFRENFSAYTGQWIHNHPELHKLKQIYEAYYKNGKKSRPNRKKV